MPLSAIVNSFNAGELSPFMDARSDVKKYGSGCKTLENFIILPYGGVMRRPGTQYLGAAKYANRRCRLIGFNFSTTTRFVIEMGHQYLRFWSNGVQVQTGGNPVEVASPFTEEQIREVQYVQINDVMYFVHPEVAPRKLSRFSDTNWVMAEVSWDWPALLEENVTDTTLTCSHTTGNARTLTASASLFNANHVGSYWQLAHTKAANYIETDIDGNKNSSTLTVFGDWEFSTSGIWSALLTIEQSEDNGATWQAIRKYKGSADRNLNVEGKTDKEVLLRVNISSYDTGDSWADSTSYSKGDIRIYEVNVYKCVLAHNNTATAWSEFAGNYSAGDIVSWGENKYKCIKAHNNTTSNWAATGQTYSVGNLVKYNERTYKCVKGHNTSINTFPRNQYVAQGSSLQQYDTALKKWYKADEYAQLVFDFPAGNYGVTNNRIYVAGYAYYRGVNSVGQSDTTANHIANSRLQQLTSSAENNAYSDAKALTEANICYEINYSPDNPEYWELSNFRPTNYEYWEPIDFTPSNQKYWTPINYETRVARLEALDSLQYGVVKVTGYTSPTQVTVNVIEPLGNTTATTTWSEGAWSVASGYPRTVMLHEGRIWYGGTAARPLSVWGSVVEDYENMRLSSNSDGGLFVTLSSKEANRIQWMESQDKLMIGTSGNEWTLGASNADEGITPANVQAQKQSSYGSKYMSAATINDVMLFVQRQGRKVRELTYVLDRDGWVAPDLTVLSEHITAGEIVESDYQQQSDAIFWAIRGDGQLVGMTYERDQEVVGWHRHTTDGAFESVATIYGLSGSDEVWLAVRRTINGQTVRYIERFAIGAREDFDTQNKPHWWHLDCAVRYQGAATATMSGLSHLNAKTVHVLGDGAVLTPKTVASASIDLEKSCTVILAGLPFTSVVQPMTLDIPNLPDGTSRGRHKRIDRVNVSVQKSMGGEVSTDGVTWQWLYPRDFDDPMDASPPPFSGDTEVVVASDYDRNIPLYIRQTQPLPMTILALVPKITYYGD